MVAPASSFNDLPCPLPPELRSDIAYRRAQGSSWEAVGCALNYRSDALRRATENDPAFALAQDRAWAEAWREGQADGMHRLRGLTNSSDEKQAMEASEILLRYAAEQREIETKLAVEKLRAETRLAVEKLRAETRLEVERLRAERRAAKAEPEPEPEMVSPYAAALAEPLPKTPEEWAALRERQANVNSAQEPAEVYLWGGKHKLGRSAGPDEFDTRVHVKADWSCGAGARGVIYWVVPDPVPPEALMPGDPGYVVPAW